MTRKEAKEFVPILQAYAEGKTIQSRCIKSDKVLWCDDNPRFDDDYVYRIKPKPKCRPFKDAKECWNEMLKHQPFGWITCDDDSVLHKFVSIGGLADNEAIFNTNLDFTYEELVEYYTFADGTPCGIRED